MISDLAGAALTVAQSQAIRVRRAWTIQSLADVRTSPAYSDARARAQKLGDFNFYSSYMSQPKFQLETFKSWAGIDSDISYYLNSHHIDVNLSVFVLGFAS